MKSRYSSYVSSGRVLSPMNKDKDIKDNLSVNNLGINSPFDRSK